MYDFSGQEQTERLLLFPIARVWDCLLTAHLPTRIIRNVMHTFEQLGSLFPALNFPAARKENFSQGCKLAGWHYRFTHPKRLFVHFLEAFWKLFSSRCRWVLPVNYWWMQELLKILFSLIYSQTPSVVVNRNTSEVWGRPCFHPHRPLIRERRMEAGVCVQGVVSREEEG